MHSKQFQMAFGCLLLALWAALPAYSFRMDALPADAGVSTAQRRNDVMPAPARLAAAETLGNVQVHWDAGTGAPNSIRGPGLQILAKSDKGSPAMRAIEAMQALAGLYGIRNAAAEFKADRVQSDLTGNVHVRLNQFHGGLRVVGGVILAHFDADGSLYQVNGRYVPNLALALFPAIDASAAATLATKAMAQQGLSTPEFKPAPELVVYALGPEPALAYEVNTWDRASSFGLWRVWIDARSGMVLRIYDRTPRASRSVPNPASITGQILVTEGDVNVTVTGCMAGSRYYLQHISLLSNSLWRVYNASANAGYVDSLGTAARTNADWGSTDRFEMSAMFNFGLIDGYYRTAHNRRSFDNGERYGTVEGDEAVANVHVEGGFNNAYWHPLYQQFYFYPGDQYEMADTAVLDICAHEYTHAVNQYSANIDYYSESGAISESFSDIFGALVEFASQTDGRHLYPGKQAGTADWLLGEDAFLSATALRDIREPGSMTTVSMGYQQPSRYHGTQWYYGAFDNAGVHINSGVQNKFFYLLSEGGLGVNDGLSYSITGIGISNAASIAYRALTVYCTEYGTGYEAVREYWLSAAADLNPAWTTAVEQAWAAVGVGVAPIPDASVMAVYELSSGQWNVNTINGAALVSGENWGGPGFTPLLTDCNADGLPDMVVYCEASGMWYGRTLNKTTLFWGVPWGGPGLTPVPGDYNGDGAADLALFQGSSGAWYVFSLNGTILAWGVISGSAGCLSVPGDYNADGCSDLAAYDPLTGIWTIRKTNGEPIMEGAVCGGTGLTPVPGDFDGDGRSDFAVYAAESGRWYVFSLAAGWLVWDEAWGGPGFVPVSGDYDGDGITDLSVYDSASGNWYVRTRSGAIVLWSKLFGNSTMIPVSN